MSHRRHFTICREGWYYLLVLAFIMLVAVIRHINLLFILVGLLVGPLIFNWRMVAISLRKLNLRRKLPRRVCAGDPFTVEVVVENERRRLDSWALVVRDTIALEGSKAKDQRTTVEVMLPRVVAGESSQASYRCLLTRRGRYLLGPASIVTRYPFGLITASSRINRRTPLIVCPRLGRLTNRWTRLLEAERAGSQRRQHRRGHMEDEFYGLREWRGGDSRRLIHWRTTAKLNTPTVRQFEQPRNHDLALFLDLAADAKPDEDQQQRIELAVSFAATAVADLCRRGGSRLAFAVSGQENIHYAANASQVFMQEMLERLAVVAPGDGENLSQLLYDVASESPQGTRAIVISTRPRDRRALGEDDASDRPRVADFFRRLAWIDVSGDDWRQWLHLD